MAKNHLSQQPVELEAQKFNCDWVMEKAKELKALLSYNDPRMLAANNSRASSAIATMRNALSELEQYIKKQVLKDEEEYGEHQEEN